MAERRDLSTGTAQINSKRFGVDSLFFISTAFIVSMPPPPQPISCTLSRYNLDIEPATNLLGSVSFERAHTQKLVSAK